jgi:hypothetical protein
VPPVVSGGSGGREATFLLSAFNAA